MADVERDRPYYGWSIDEAARKGLEDVERRLAALEGGARDHDKRLDGLEGEERRRKGRVDDLAGLGKALGWLAALGGALVAWLNYRRG